jgi:hypothetical protein
MTVNISDLMRVLSVTEISASAEDASDWRALRDALATYEDLPINSLTAKLGRIVLKKPNTKSPRAPSSGGSRPRVTAAQRKEALELHAAALKAHFHDDAAFSQAFEKAKADRAVDAKTALALFEKVVGPANFPTSPLRKPSVFKQLREQRNTIAYRRERTGQRDD